MDRNHRFCNSTHVRREVYEAHTYIINHFLEELTWDDVADHVGLSKNYLRTLYSGVYRYSLNQTVRGCRMKYAARLLVDTTRSVRDISLESGYQDLAYFCRRFREWSGMTPTEFRKKYTDLNSVSQNAYKNSGSQNAYKNSGSQNAYKNSGSQNAYKNSGSQNAYKNSGSQNAYKNSGSQNAYKDSGSQNAYKPVHNV